jgi:hypothetical protein
MPKRAESLGFGSNVTAMAMSGIGIDVRNAVRTVPKRQHYKTLIKSIGLEFWNSRAAKPDRITVGQRGVEGGRRSEWLAEFQAVLMGLNGSSPFGTI